MAETFVFPSEAFTATALARLEKIANMQFRPHRVTQAVMQSAKDVTGGESLLIPWDVNEHSVTTQHTTGYEPIDLDVRTVLEPGRDDWAWTVSPIAVSWVDTGKNRGPEKQLDLVDERTENTIKRMEREFEQQVLQGTVAVMSDFNTWNGDDVADGFIEAAAVGTQNNVVHGKSKLTLAALPGFQNQFVDILGSFSTNGLARLIDMHTRVREITEDPMQLHGWASLEGGINYLRTVQQNERYMRDDPRDGVPTKLIINGMGYDYSTEMPDSGTATTAKPWSFLLTDMRVIKFHGQSGLKFNLMPFRDLGGGHLVRVAFLQLAGQNAIHYWGTTGIAVDGDAF